MGSHPPPPPSSFTNDFRLPSIKDLNFQYPPAPAGTPPPARAHVRSRGAPPAATAPPLQPFAIPPPPLYPHDHAKYHHAPPPPQPPPSPQRRPDSRAGPSAPPPPPRAPPTPHQHPAYPLYAQPPQPAPYGYPHAPPPPPPGYAPGPYPGYPPYAQPYRPPYPQQPGTPAAEGDKGSVRQDTIAEIVRLCQTLYQFANRYAQIQAGTAPPPNAQELADMSHRAGQVVRLLENLKRIVAAETEAAKENEYREQRAKESKEAREAEDAYRPPKRPWEEMEDAPKREMGGAQSKAEMDMEIIRSKRASTAGGTVPGQPKSKYRKRSRATPPGKCHSCNIRETPEWRRGPDGARTLCNACGLHYAKLVRKRDKAAAEGGGPVVDLAMLRASTAARAAENEDGSDESDEGEEALLQYPNAGMERQYQEQGRAGEEERAPGEQGMQGMRQDGMQGLRPEGRLDGRPEGMQGARQEMLQAPRQDMLQAPRQDVQAPHPGSRQEPRQETQAPRQDLPAPLSMYGQYPTYAPQQWVAPPAMPPHAWAGPGRAYEYHK